MVFVKSRTAASILLLAAIVVSSCSPTYKRNKEAREDAEELAASYQAQKMIQHQLTADGETFPVGNVAVETDAADDPAIWYNEANPAASTIIGTNKQYGLHVYDLNGVEVQSLPIGKINNVDIRSTKDCQGNSIDVVAGSNRSAKSVDIHVINSNGTVGNQLLRIDLGKFKPYGFSLYHDASGLSAYVNAKSGETRQYLVSCNAGKWTARLVRTLKLKTQVEGMVADDENQIIYIGEEEKAVYAFEANVNGGTKPMMIPESTSANKYIDYDIEGVALLPPHYLLVSSQGNFSYAIFDLKDQVYVTSFALLDGAFDGVEETDGLEICAKPMGDKYPEGILVVQDGFNFDGEVKKTQNFKIVDLRKIKAFLD